MKREIKPFMVTVEQIKDYTFTKAQVNAYESLKKATERCKKVGLTLLAKNDGINAYPNKFMDNWMNDVGGSYESEKRVEIPHLCGAKISDSGADDPEYIKDKYIK